MRRRRGTGRPVAPLAAQRRAVLAGSPELQERGRPKFADIVVALAGALRNRGVDADNARLLASVGVAIFQSGFDRWIDDPHAASLSMRIREAAEELAGAVAPTLPPYTPHDEHPSRRATIPERQPMTMATPCPLPPAPRQLWRGRNYRT
jgi:hypothetical protein